jgi:hypothetical protein
MNVNAQKRKVAAVLFIITAMILAGSARGAVSVEYLCCAWGPVMTLPTKAREKPQFDDSQEEVYFLKQVTGHGVGIYLCKMKADGSEKTEIKELWRNPNYPIDTQDCTTWMDVCVKTHQIAVTVTYAGSDLTGLWTMNMDGSDLRRIITPAHTTNGLQSVGSATWTPDGQWIVYGESIRGAGRNGRIAKCDKNGEKRVYLTDGPWDNDPSSSPDGKHVAFIHWTIKGDVHDRWLWLVDLDGSNSRPLPNPAAKPNWSAQAHWGLFPAWSPDGKSVLLECGIIDLASGKVRLERCPMLQGKQGTYGWPHWGKSGFVGFSVGGILLTDLELYEAKWIGSSKLAHCSGAEATCRW